MVEAVGLRLKGLCPNDAEVISETARKVLALGFPTNQDEFFETCYKFLEVQLQAERNCKSKHVISDRSLVDFLAYIRANKDMKLPKALVSLIEEIVRWESKYFDLYCILPIEFGLVLDDLRSPDVEHQKAVDKTLRAILREFKLPHKQIRGTIEQRTEKIMAILGLRS